MASTPPMIAAANFDLNGFHTLYSIFSPSVYNKVIFKQYLIIKNMSVFMYGKVPSEVGVWI